MLAFPTNDTHERCRSTQNERCSTLENITHVARSAVEIYNAERQAKYICLTRNTGVFPNSHTVQACDPHEDPIGALYKHKQCCKVDFLRTAAGQHDAAADPS